MEIRNRVKKKWMEEKELGAGDDEVSSEESEKKKQTRTRGGRHSPRQPAVGVN